MRPYGRLGKDHLRPLPMDHATVKMRHDLNELVHRIPPDDAHAALGRGLRCLTRRQDDRAHTAYHRAANLPTIAQGEPPIQIQLTETIIARIDEGVKCASVANATSRSANLRE